MNSVWSLLFVLSLVLFISVNCQKMCVLNDYVCMTKGGQKLFKSLPIKDIDPLHVDEIPGITGNFNYKITNSTLSGLSNCDVTFIIANKEETKYEHHLTCPKLVIKYLYEINGKLRDYEMVGQSTGQVTASDYVIITYGQYGINISETDKIPHFYTKSFYIDTHPGNLKFETDKLLTTKGVNIGPYIIDLINKYWRAYERYIRDPILTKFMTLLLSVYDKKLSTLTLSQSFPDES